VLRDVRGILDLASDWTAERLEAVVKEYHEGKEMGLGSVAQPIRVAISGTTVSPPIFHSLDFLGRERTLKRIDRCLGM
jgi:glutamyl-tRNA synthetase